MNKKKQMKKSLNKYLIITCILGLILIQFFRTDKSVPVTDPALDFFVEKNPPRKIIAAIRTSCYDCHSYQTSYPWYSSIAPVSWLLQSHIKEGREHLNFSEYANYSREQRNHLLSEMQEVIEENEMPLRSYTLIHRNAKLNQDMRESLVTWLTEGKNAIQTP
jgi:hypothetical protein